MYIKYFLLFRNGLNEFNIKSLWICHKHIAHAYDYHTDIC